MDDPDGKDFPWAPKSFLDIMKGATLITNTDGKEMKWEDVQGTHVGVYFSAHWVSHAVN